MTEIKIRRGNFKGNEIIGVKSPYNKNFIEFAKELKAMWDAKNEMWVFVESQREIVENELELIYGWLNPNKEKIQVRIVFDKLTQEQKESRELKIRDLVIVERKYRDAQPRILNCIYNAKFKKSAGSSAHPEIAPLDGETATIELPETLKTEIEKYNFLEIVK